MDAYQPLDERLFNALTVRWPAIALDTRLCLSVFCQFVGIGWINNTVVSEHLPVNVLERFALDEQGCQRRAFYATDYLDLFLSLITRFHQNPYLINNNILIKRFDQPRLHLHFLHLERFFYRNLHLINASCDLISR